ncbi:hypothetical protein CDAR_77212, partial [Caerostris darwini]
RMNKKSVKKIKRKKVPIYFRKNQAAVSQILATAHYKRRLKEMRRVNKELAQSLHDVHHRVADQERALAEFNRESIQMIFAKRKIKDICAGFQKLVIDMSEVMNYLGGKQCDFLKSSRDSHDDIRLKLLHPNVSIVEESASESIIESDLIAEERQHYEINPDSVSSESIPEIDVSTRKENSLTEIYNIPSFTAANTRSQDFSNDAQSVEARVSNKFSKQSSSCSFELSSTPHTSVFTAFEKPLTKVPNINITELELDTTSSSPAMKKTEPTVSNISKLKSVSTLNVDSQSAASSNHNQRKAFITEKLQDGPNMFSLTSDQTRMCTLNSLAVNNRKETFLVPDKLVEKLVPSSPNIIKTNTPTIIKTVQNVVQNEAILLCEDMKLTEIMPVKNQPQFHPSISPCTEVMESEETSIIGSSDSVKELKSSKIERTSSRVSSLLKKRSASGKLNSRNSDVKANRSSNKNSMRNSSVKNTLEALPENELLNPPKSLRKSERRSSRKKDRHFYDIFDSDESDIDLDIDFEIKKRFSLKPGRKIINPNNKRVFVFNITKKPNSNMNVPIDSAINNSEEGKEEKKDDVFYFSASYEADKSPIKKSQTSKKTMSSNSKKASTNKKSIVRDKLLPGEDNTISKSNIPDDGTSPVKQKTSTTSRKSILCLNNKNESQSSQFNLKFTRVTLANRDKINALNNNSSFEVNLISSENDSKEEIIQEEKSQSQNSYESKQKPSVKRKYSSAKRCSFKATGEMLNHSSVNPKRSTKRTSSSLNSKSEHVEKLDVNSRRKSSRLLHYDLKNCKTLPKLDCTDHKQAKDTNICSFENSDNSSQVVSNKNTKRNPEEDKNTVIPKQLTSQVDEKIMKTSKECKENTYKVKRSFSSISEHGSKKRSTIGDDDLSELENVTSNIDNKRCNYGKTDCSSSIVSVQNSEKNKNIVVISKILISQNKEDLKISKADKPMSDVSEISKKQCTGEDNTLSGIKNVIPTTETALSIEIDKHTEIYNIKDFVKSVSPESNLKKCHPKKTKKAITKQELKKGDNSKDILNIVQSTYLDDDTDNEKENASKIDNKNIKDVLCNYDSKLCKFDTLSSIENKCPVVVNSPVKHKAKSSRKKRRCENDTVALKVETHSKNMQPSVEMDSLLLIQKQPNSVILSSANSIEPENINGCRPRRNRPTINFKEPSLNR